MRKLVYGKIDDSEIQYILTPSRPLFYADFTEPKMLIDMAQFYYNWAINDPYPNDDGTVTIEYISKINYVAASSLYTCDAMCEMVSITFDPLTGTEYSETVTFDRDRRFYYRVNPSQPAPNFWENSANTAWTTLDDCRREFFNITSNNQFTKNLVSYSAAKKYAKDNNYADSNDYRESAAQTLKQYLEDIFHLLPISEKDQAIISLLIDSINEDGYLEESLDYFLASIPKEYEVNIEEIESLLKLLQKQAPPGIGARDLIECLTLQLESKEETPIHTLSIKVIKNHLNLLAARDFVRLKKILG
jgi:hypothetical protein